MNDTPVTLALDQISAAAARVETAKRDYTQSLRLGRAVEATWAQVGAAAGKSPAACIQLLQRAGKAAQ